jgi:hypothetical protein
MPYSIFVCRTNDRDSKVSCISVHEVDVGDAPARRADQTVVVVALILTMLVSGSALELVVALVIQDYILENPLLS